MRFYENFRERSFVNVFDALKKKNNKNNHGLFLVNFYPFIHFFRGKSNSVEYQSIKKIRVYESFSCSSPKSVLYFLNREIYESRIRFSFF